jgi:hypothetical protein
VIEGQPVDSHGPAPSHAYFVVTHIVNWPAMYIGGPNSDVKTLRVKMDKGVKSKYFEIYEINLVISYNVA